MGEVASIIKAFSCDSCAKYVCNACDIHSSCSDCCDFEVSTAKVDLPEDSDYEIEVDGCCSAKKGQKRNADSEAHQDRFGGPGETT